MVANTGTYLDAPFHRYPDGDDLATMPLEGIVDLDGVLIDAVGHRSIDTDQLRAHRVARRAVLIRTGWSQNWGSDACYTGHPYLTSSAVGWLVEQRAALVGIDSLNIDATGTGKRPVHSRLLAARVPHRRTPVPPGRPPSSRLPLHGRPSRGGWTRLLSGAGVRDRGRGRLSDRAATLIAITQDRSRAQLGSASLRWLIRLDYERAKDDREVTRAVVMRSRGGCGACRAPQPLPFSPRGGGRESNPPGSSRPHTGFEDRGAHQVP